MNRSATDWMINDIYEMVSYTNPYHNAVDSCGLEPKAHMRMKAYKLPYKRRVNYTPPARLQG